MPLKTVLPRAAWPLMPWLLPGLLLLLLGCARGAPACAEAEPVPWQAVAPGVWVWLPSRDEDIAARNAGHVAPTGLVIDGNEALVVDPGPSHRHGLRVAASLRCRFGARATWVVNTHAHAENVLGNSALAAARAHGAPRIAASPAALTAMRRRCPECLRHLHEQIGSAAMAGTHTLLPDTPLQAGTTLRVGRRSLQVLAVVSGHSEGDLVLWDAEAGVLWAGGLVYGQRLPELAQGSLVAWLAALDDLERLPVRELIGTTWSRGQPGLHPPPALEATRAYLQALHDGVLQAMDRGRQPTEADLLPLPAHAARAGYAQRHTFNVMRAWRELEPVWMAREPLPQQIGR